MVVFGAILHLEAPWADESKSTEDKLDFISPWSSRSGLLDRPTPAHILAIVAMDSNSLWRRRKQLTLLSAPLRAPDT